jgi:hypothetical protein
VQLPSDFKTFAHSQTTNGLAPSQAFLSHCARELMHAQWEILLEDGFVAAWKSGNLSLSETQRLFLWLTLLVRYCYCLC